MANRYFKDYLQHAWVNTDPSVVSNYNREYYKKHANDWVIRKNRRLNGTLTSSNSDSIPNITNTAVGGNSNTSTKKSFRPNLDYGGQKVYDIVHAMSSVVDVGKRLINTIIEWRKEVHIRRQDKGSTIGGMIKAGLNWIKENVFS